MPRNGAGVFSLVNNTWFPPVNGVLATATDWTPFITDVQNALTQSVSSDGQTPMTGNLPMGNNKITGLAAGSANTDAVNFSQLTANIAPQTSVELNYVSTTSVILQGSNGGYLWINGTNYSVGAGGVIKTLPTLSTTTVYNVYAFWTGTVIDLEFSTTAFVTGGPGIPQKTGDATRTLVGRIRTNSTTTTYNTVSDAGVVTYWNRKRRSVTQSIQINQNTVSGTDVGLLTGPTFISWGIDATDFVSTANNGNTVDTAQNITTVYVNGAAASAGATTGISGAGGVGSAFPRISFAANSGYVITSLQGRVNAGTGTWFVGSDLQAVFMG